jgi:carbonic anhydrase
MLVCMDARLDVAEMTGDTRHVAYVVRTAGSVIGEAEEEMLELAVLRGVKLLVLTRHTDCAAEAIAADPQQRARFPALAEAIDARDRRVTGFLARPAIASRVAEGTLLVKEVLIDTSTERVTEVVAAHQH